MELRQLKKNNTGMTVFQMRSAMIGFQEKHIAPDKRFGMP